MKRKYFQMIQSGEKKLEARLNYPFLRNIKIGDSIVFYWESEFFPTKVNAVRHYNSFEEMLNSENVGLLLPGFSKEVALREYQKIYSEDKIKKNSGILVISFEKA